MVKVLFFARLREQLGVDTLEAPHAAGLSVAGLREQLAAERGDAWRALREQNVVCAVNQVVVADSHLLADGDEVAFFPPVTGG